MKKRYKITKIITLLLYIVQTRCDEKKEQDLVAQLQENALKKYPWIMNEDISETVIPSSSFRRHGGQEWHHDIENRPLSNRQWYKNTQTFAFDLQYNVRTGGDTIKLRGCYMIITTLVGASRDMRRYYTMRYLYHDHVDFEIGYMVHEIIMKYQNLIELFHIARKKYFYNRHKHNAPTKYLFNKYLNILETSNAIIHLCNMFHEIRFKFADMGADTPLQNQIWDDERVEKHIGAPVTVSYDTHKPPSAGAAHGMGEITLAEMEAKLEKERKKKRKALKQQTNRWGPTFTPYPTSQTQYKSWRWPLIYGWSIEDW